MPFLPSLPEKASLLDVFKKYPETNRPLIELHEALLRAPSPFTEAERELIAAYVSRKNGCGYCSGVHTLTAEKMGVPEGLVDQLMDGVETADAKMQPVLRYAAKLTDDPSSMTQADVDAVFAAGWEEEALYYLVATTACFNYMNRLVEGLGIELDPDYVGPSSDRLSKRGYLPLLHLMKQT